MSSIKNKINQYGYKNSLIREFKAIGRKFGLMYEKYILIIKDLDDYIEPPNPKIELTVKELNYENLENDNSLKFDLNKLLLFKKRFSSGNYIALGAYHQNNLVYCCWISLKNFETSPNLKNSLKLDKKECLIVDAYTHPEFRGLGIHSYMNAIRANKLHDLNKKRALGLVLAENIPSRKAQSKIGFRGEKIILYIKIFGKEFIKIKSKEIKL